MTAIFEYNNSLTDMICENIIEQFEENNGNNNIFNIPKNNKEWERIERLLYKELLMRLNDYKNKLLENINLNNELCILMNNELYTKHFSIQKINIGKDEIVYNFTPNRYNVLTYIFYLNDVDDGGEVVFASSENRMLYFSVFEISSLILFLISKSDIFIIFIKYIIKNIKKSFFLN